MSDYNLNSFNYHREITQPYEGNTYNQHLDSKTCYKQALSDRKYWQLNYGSRSGTSEDDSRELENILSTQTQINTSNCARQNSLKNCPPNIPVLQHFQQSKTTPETTSGDTLQKQVIESTRQKYEKMQLKKAAHKRIEKRRMTFINDKIAELQRLLPENVNRSSCTNKGSIFKGSVDYIKSLQTDLDPIRQLQEKVLEINREQEKLTTRVEILERQTSSKFDLVLTEPLPKELPITS